MKREATVTPPPPPPPAKPSLSEEEMNKKSTAIIEEYIHIYDIKVAPSQAVRFSVPRGCGCVLTPPTPPCANRRLCSACRS